VSKARQQRANVKQRKAKSRALHEQQFGSYAKKKAARQSAVVFHRPPNIGTSAALSLAAMERLIAQWDGPSDEPFTLRYRP
jgi:hypothetical protein